MPPCKRQKVIESVLKECLGLYKKPKAEVHPGHKLMGSKEEEDIQYKLISNGSSYAAMFVFCSIPSNTTKKLINRFSMRYLKNRELIKYQQVWQCPVNVMLRCIWLPMLLWKSSKYFIF